METADYDAFLARKVELARASLQVGRGRVDDDVEAEFAARRAVVLGAIEA